MNFASQIIDFFFLWTDMEEVIGFILAGITVCVNAYAIFLCFAIYDYQDEKPSADKSPIDVFVKGWLISDHIIHGNNCPKKLLKNWKQPR